MVNISKTTLGQTLGPYFTGTTSRSERVGDLEVGVDSLLLTVELVEALWIGNVPTGQVSYPTTKGFLPTHLLGRASDNFTDVRAGQHHFGRSESTLTTMSVGNERTSDYRHKGQAH